MQWKIKNLVSLFFLINIFIISFSYELILKYKVPTINENIRNAQVKAVHPAIRNVRNFQNAPANFKVIEVDEADKDEIIDILNKENSIEYVHPNYQARLHYVPDDSYYLNYSAYRDLFTFYGAQSAWDISTGSEQVVVAVLDSGVNYSHQDLQGRILTQHGYDFGNNDSDPMDYDSHGTHVAGIIGANGDNSLGVVGIDWNCKILPVKVFSDAGSGNSDMVIDGIYYAVNKGAKVINLSLAFYNSYTGLPVYFEGALQDAIDYAYSQGVIIVASAGNEGLDISTYKLSPVCNDGNSNKVIGVSALNNDKSKVSFSNFSSGYVDISAFGVNVWSTVLNDNYAQKSGTSMAAPAVSGIIALLLSISPGLSPAQVMDYLRLSAENINTQNPGYLNQLGAGLIKADDTLDVYLSTQNTTNTTEKILHFYNYPNPLEASVNDLNSTTFYAEFTNPVSNATIEIYSITGRKVHEIKITQISSTQLFFSWSLETADSYKIPPGVYFAVLKADINGEQLSKHHKVLIK